ncbi:hypothetical protein PBI_LINDA_73 [Arthrobacter phage Linda]|nr:hypothetical protein PBI_LINDA_73 [Arthrobacter phage Linda]
MRLESVVIITLPECGAKVQHEKHVLRHGFLHLCRTKCEGWDIGQWMQYQQIMNERELRAQQTLYKKQPKHYPGPQHKHNMFLSQWWTTEHELVFICDWRTAGCKFEHRISRGLWQRQTINGLRARLARQAVAPLFKAIRERAEDE